MIGKVIKYRMQDLWKMCLILLGSFLLGVILFTVIMAFSGDDETVFELGTTIMAIVVVFLCLFMEGLGLQSEFNMMIGMGVTRKDFTVGYYISSLIMTALELGLVYVAHFVETWNLRMFYAGKNQETGIEGLLFSWYVIPVIFVVVGLGFFLGTVVSKAGKKALIFVWILWMVGCFAPGQIENAMERGDNSFLAKFGTWVVNAFTGITPVTGLVIMVTVSVVTLVGGVLLLKKQRVTL